MFQKGAIVCLLGYSVCLFLSAHGELELIALVGALLGILVRTYFPWIRKIAEGKLFGNFDMNYAITALLSFVATGHFITMLGESIMQALGAIYTFVTTFLFGLGLNSVVNEAKKWFFGTIWREETVAIMRVIGFLTNPQIIEQLKKLGVKLSVELSKEKEEAQAQQ